MSTPATFAVCFALVLGGCASRALETPPDGGVDLAHVKLGDLASPALASVDLARADLSSGWYADLAIADLATPAHDAAMPTVDIDLGPDELVYAHSSEVLYALDPRTMAIAEVGPFGWPGSLGDQMTDIALDQRGNMIGVSYSSFYAVDPYTAKCTWLADTAIGDINALTFVVGSDPDAAETLIGAANDGSVYRIDPSTGAQTWLGYYGNDFGSSGDLVSVAGATYATAVGYDSDVLLKVDPDTGLATEIGETGVYNIWGLGYWQQTLFGFTETSGIVRIDVDTGLATPIYGTSSISFWGAGVITAAPTSN